MKKLTKLAAAAILGLASVCALSSPAEAAIQTIEASGVYVMDSRLGETTEAATGRAREDAKRAAAEKAGVYVESYSKTVNMVLEADEVRTIAAQLLKIQGEKSKVAVLEDSLLQFTVTITALVDDSGVDMQRAVSTDKSVLSEDARRNSELQREYDELKKQMEELKRRYEGAGEAQRAEIKAEAAANTQRFGAAEELEKANGLFARGDYTQALSAYTRALGLNPRLPEAYNNRGLAYYHLRQYSEAVNDFNQAAALKPNFLQAYSNRGMVHLEQGQAAQAIQDCTQALSIDSRFAPALNNRGRAYVAAGQADRALGDLQQAARIMPGSADIHNNLGSAYMMLKSYREAVNEYGQAIRLNGNFAEAYYNRALAYCNLGQFMEALPDAQRAKELNPGDGAASDLYSRIRSKLGG